MKKLHVLLWAMVICILFAACGGNTPAGNTDLGNSNTETDSTAAVSSPDNAEKSDENDLIIKTDGGPCINANRFAELVETVELTTENWREYIDTSFNTYERIDEKNAFGEVTATSMRTTCHMMAKTDKYFQFVGTEERPAAIELKHKTTGEVLIEPLEGWDYLLPYSVKNADDSFFEKYNMDNYDCTRIQGTLYIVDIPEEAIVDSGDDLVEMMVSVANKEKCIGTFGLHLSTRKIHMFSVAEILNNCN